MTNAGPERDVIALDWRGFGASQAASSDSYWFYDYYADLDAVIDRISPDAPIDLLGHSMGGNIAMIYAGTCPQRIRRLVNVEGFGLARTEPAEAPARLAKWLAELKAPVSIRTFASQREVAAHLMKRSPHMDEGFAIWLAARWAQAGADGRWHVMADAVHKRTNPILYRCDEVLAAWENIEAEVLWVEGDKVAQTPLANERYSREEFESRLGKIKALERVRINECGHTWFIWSSQINWLRLWSASWRPDYGFANTDASPPSRFVRRIAARVKAGTIDSAPFCSKR